MSGETELSDDVRPDDMRSGAAADLEDLALATCQEPACFEGEPVQAVGNDTVPKRPC